LIPDSPESKPRRPHAASHAVVNSHNT
jgi:hypothetical protein